MKWLNNLKSIATDKKAGPCPYCHSNNTDYGFVVGDKETHIGYGAVWCNDCRRACHISRVLISADTKIASVPKDLKY